MKIPILMLTLVSTAAAQGMGPSGPFGYLLHASYADPSNKLGFALIGLMTTARGFRHRGGEPRRRRQPDDLAH